MPRSASPALLALVLAAAAAPAAQGQATSPPAGPPCLDELCAIPAGDARLIDRHGFCRVVQNNNDLAVMVPTRSPQEWYDGPNAFLAEERFGMDLDFCPEPIVFENLSIAYAGVCGEKGKATDRVCSTLDLTDRTLGDPYICNGPSYAPHLATGLRKGPGSIGGFRLSSWPGASINDPDHQLFWASCGDPDAVNLGVMDPETPVSNPGEVERTTIALIDIRTLAQARPTTLNDTVPSRQTRKPWVPNPPGFAFPVTVRVSGDGRLEGEPRIRDVTDPTNPGPWENSLTYTGIGSSSAWSRFEIEATAATDTLTARPINLDFTDANGIVLKARHYTWTGFGNFELDRVTSFPRSISKPITISGLGPGLVKTVSLARVRPVPAFPRTAGDLANVSMHQSIATPDPTYTVAAIKYCPQGNCSNANWLAGGLERASEDLTRPHAGPSFDVQDGDKIELYITHRNTLSIPMRHRAALIADGQMVSIFDVNVPAFQVTDISNEIPGNNNGVDGPSGDGK